MARPKKSLGQHFLTDVASARAVIDAAGIGPGVQVLEIGPGRGFLTRYLLKAGAQVVAVEKDDGLARRLGSTMGGEALQVVSLDFLDFDLSSLGFSDAVAVGNLPYNVAMPILVKTLSVPEMWRNLVFMFQLEVAQRVCAGPGSRKYGVPSVCTALTHNARVIRRVPPGAFFPPPRVESALVLFEPLEQPLVSPQELRAASDFVGSLFRYRRKKAANSMARAVSLSPAECAGALESLGASPDARPEQLSPATLAALWRLAQST